MHESDENANVGTAQQMDITIAVKNNSHYATDASADEERDRDTM